MTVADEPAPGPPRTLADILREAGIEPVGRGGRRRRGEPDGEQWPGPEPAGEPAQRVESVSEGRPEPEPSPEAQRPVPAEPPAAAARPSSARARGRHGAVPVGGPGKPPTAVARTDRDRSDATADVDQGGEVSRRAGALGWLAFAVELVVAAVLGVVIWYAFSLLWELYPYAAAVAAPVVLAGVAIAGQSLRRRNAPGTLSPMAITALLLVAAFLVVLPAAAVLSRS